MEKGGGGWELCIFHSALFNNKKKSLMEAAGSRGAFMQFMQRVNTCAPLTHPAAMLISRQPLYVFVLINRSPAATETLN